MKKIVPIMASASMVLTSSATSVPILAKEYIDSNYSFPKYMIPEPKEVNVLQPKVEVENEIQEEIIQEEVAQQNTSSPVYVQNTSNSNIDSKKEQEIIDTLYKSYLEKQVSTTASNYENAQVALQELLTKLENAQSKCDSTLNTLSANQAAYNEQASYKEASLSLASLQAEKNNLETQLASLPEKASLQNNLTTLQQQESTLSASLSGLDAESEEYASISSQLNAVSQEISSISATIQTIDSLTASIANVASNITTAESLSNLYDETVYSELETKVSESQEAYDQAVSELASLNTSISEQEEKVKETKQLYEKAIDEYAQAIGTTPELTVKYTYEQNGYTFEKISHASSATEEGDGIIDYKGNHDLEEYVDGKSELGYADTTQSYTYCAVTSGDWVYMGTMYGALGAYSQAKRALTSMGYSEELATSIVDAAYNGKLNTGAESDGYNAGSIFFKFNAVSGETKIIMSREMYENGECDGVPIFRNAVEYNGKLYFVGLVSNGTALDQYNGYPLSQAAALNLEIMIQSGVPCIYELDPNTDELIKVYQCVSVEDYRELNAQNIFTSTRAISTITDSNGKEWLTAGGLYIDQNGNASAQVLITDESMNWTMIADSENGLYSYPAINRNDSEGGGGIYQIIQYGGYVYVGIISGKYDADPEKNKKNRSFAIVRGKCDGDYGNASDWTWTVLCGDKDNDGAKYTFGIDPERTASGGVTLNAYNGYLYIGEYNDVNGGLTGVLQQQDFSRLAENLSQSINLYRMNENEEIELVVGDATEMFKDGSITGIGSGYATHMTQYTWMTAVYDGTLYLSTMDESSLLRPLVMFANGDILNMSEEEWQSEIGYIKIAIQEWNKEHNKDATTLASINASLTSMSALYSTTNVEDFYNYVLEIQEKLEQLSSNAQEIKEKIQNLMTPENIQKMKDFLTCLHYMQDAEAGFDLYAIKDDGENVTVETISTNGFNDRYNHGLRIFATTDDYMVIGTANPFLGAQVWRMSETPENTYSHQTHHYETKHVNEETNVVTMECVDCGDGYKTLNDIVISENPYEHIENAQAIINNVQAGIDSEALDSIDKSSESLKYSTEAIESNNLTEKNLEEAKKAMEAAKATESVKKANEQAILAQEAADAAKENAQIAFENVQKAQEEYDLAVEKYEAASKKYNEAQEEIQTQLDAGLISAQEAVKKAELAKIELENELKEKESAITNLEAALEEATLKFEEANIALSEAEQALEETQEALKEALSKQTNITAATGALLAVSDASVLTEKGIISYYENNISMLDEQINALQDVIDQAQANIDEANENIANTTLEGVELIRYLNEQDRIKYENQRIIEAAEEAQSPLLEKRVEYELKLDNNSIFEKALRIALGSDETITPQDLGMGEEPTNRFEKALYWIEYAKKLVTNEDFVKAATTVAQVAYIMNDMNGILENGIESKKELMKMVDDTKKLTTIIQEMNLSETTKLFILEALQEKVQEMHSSASSELANLVEQAKQDIMDASNAFADAQSNVENAEAQVSQVEAELYFAKDDLEETKALLEMVNRKLEEETAQLDAVIEMIQKTKVDTNTLEDAEYYKEVAYKALQDALAGYELSLENATLAQKYADAAKEYAEQKTEVKDKASAQTSVYTNSGFFSSLMGLSLLGFVFLEDKKRKQN